LKSISKYKKKRILDLEEILDPELERNKKDYFNIKFIDEKLK
jgi:hypothetical protein